MHRMLVSLPHPSTSSPVHLRLWCFFLFSYCLLLLAATAFETGVGSGGRAKSANTSNAEFAVYFHIYYGHSFKVVRNGVDGISYLLIQNNSRMAADMKYCTSRIKSIITPISNYSIHAEYFQASFFELLGLFGGLKGIASMGSVTSACLLKFIQEGKVTLLNDTDPQQVELFSAHFVSNLDHALTCNSVTFQPLSEDTPLQQAEWIKYAGVFANAEARSNQVYDSVKNNYLCLASAANSKATTIKPIVAWIKYYNSTWYFTMDAYKLKYVEDAGGENFGNITIKSTYNISNPEDLDEFHAMLCIIDVVIDETYTSDPAAYTKLTFLQNINVQNISFLPFMINQRLWRNDKRVQNSTAPAVTDWNDGAISQPQLVLADLVQVLYPTGNYTTTYFRNLAKEEGIINISAEMCTRDASLPLEPTTVACS